MRFEDSKRSGNFSPRPGGRGFFLTSRWYFKNGKPVLKFYSRTSNDQWRFRRSWVFQKFLKYAQKGENRTNNSSSRTRHGSDASLRHAKSIANPELCYQNFFYLKVSGYAGGNGEAFGAANVRTGAQVLSLDALRRGFSFSHKQIGIIKEVL